VKEKHLREALAAGGFHDIAYSVPLPSAPHIWVKGVDCNSAKMFKSALYPAVLSFIVDSTKSSSSSSKNNSAGGRVAGTTRQQSSKVNMTIKTMYKVMIKTGDDLRQDQLVIIVIQLMDRLLKRGTLDLW
jgi:phosphatidylinositol 3-kinase